MPLKFAVSFVAASPHDASMANHMWTSSYSTCVEPFSDYSEYNLCVLCCLSMPTRWFMISNLFEWHCYLYEDRFSHYFRLEQSIIIHFSSLWLWIFKCSPNRFILYLLYGNNDWVYPYVKFCFLGFTFNLSTKVDIKYLSISYFLNDKCLF